MTGKDALAFLIVITMLIRIHIPRIL